MSLTDRFIARITRRPPDFIIGGAERPYLRRWWLIPRNPLLNVYLHQFLRSDDDRALHDHPWANVSILLRGSYIEHTERGEQRLQAPEIRVRWSGRLAHRIELLSDWHTMPSSGRHLVHCWCEERPCWTLFITGPRYRQWGFWCPQGWKHWREFTKAENPGEVGPGCDA